MKSILDSETRNEIIGRIHSLNENSKPQWGKMTVSQMIKHCAQWDEMAFGKKLYKQSMLGRLFGKWALKDMLKDVPVKRNLPTVPSFVIKDTLDFSNEKNKWIGLISDYSTYANPGFTHPFFGTITREQTGIIAYKHMDHHLRQFNV